MAPLITLTTDFDNYGVYVASIKGAILSINVKARIVDVSHAIEPYNTLQAACIISTVYHQFPARTSHIVIIDPVVGS